MAKKQPLPPEAKPPINPKAWSASDANRERLRSILNDPVFLEACHHVKEVRRVTCDELVGQHPILNEVVLRKVAIYAGFNEFLPELRNLAEQKIPEPILQPFEHIGIPTKP